MIIMYIHEHNCTQSMKESSGFVSIFVNMKEPGSVFAPPRKGNVNFDVHRSALP